MNLKKPLKKFTSFLMALFILSAPSTAQAVGDTTQCLITVKKVFLKKPDGDWIMLLEQDRTLDLSKENSSLEIVNDHLVPPGEYTNCKLVISEAFQIAGGDGANLTKEGGEVWVEGTASKISELPGEITSLKENAPTWNTEKEGLITVHLNLDFADRDEVMEIYGKSSFSKPLKIKEGSKIEIVLNLLLARTIRYVWAKFWDRFPEHDTMYFLPPSRVDELSVKVDGITSFLEGNIEWTF